MAFPRVGDLGAVVAPVAFGQSRAAVVFSPDLKQKVRATRRRYKRYKERVGEMTIVITAGKLNFEEREFLRNCRRAKTKPKKAPWLRGVLV
jgi:hypothetical protein